jgi:UDP-N-acetylglucosamine 2-epimerase (non-hydrolysing)
MKIITIAGTRPEWVRLSRIMAKLDKLCNHIIIHTGQNKQKCLSDIFFKELDIRKPDYFLEVEGTLGKQLSIMLFKIEEIFKKEKPDKVLILGDTNSGLCSLIAERMGIPVYHAESGNRSFDKKVPEEINRKLIDSISTYNLPYTFRSREHLIREGVPPNKIFMSGNPITEVLYYYKYGIDKSKILSKLGLSNKRYFLATFHRAETVDVEDRLLEIIQGLKLIEEDYLQPIICSIHPRTRDKINKLKINISNNIKFLEPFGFFDFINLEKQARCVLTDSGTVSEECCILGTPCVIMRDSTERPELVECGSAMLSKVNSNNILLSTRIMTLIDNWQIPIGYEYINVSDKIIAYMLGANS